MPTLFKRSNGIYYISYQENAKRKWYSTGERNKTDALRKLDIFENPHSPKRTRPLLKDFIRDFLQDAESSLISNPKQQRPKLGEAWARMQLLRYLRHSMSGAV